jgi:hypothetical protein
MNDDVKPGMRVSLPDGYPRARGVVTERDSWTAAVRHDDGTISLYMMSEIAPLDEPVPYHLSQGL